MTASQTKPETDGPADDRDSASFDFEGRDVALYRPSSGQEFILLTLLSLTDDGASKQEQMETISGFGTMLRSLFVDTSDRQFVLGTLARGGEIEPFVDLARQMVEHWAIAEDEPANRTERRARERRPAKAAPRSRTR